MFKYLLLKSIFDLSDVDIVERSKYDMSFKYFLGMAPEENVIEPSFLTKFRRLRLKNINILDMLINKTVEIALEKGIIKSKSIIVYATHTASRYSQKAVFLMSIGDTLKSGKKHDDRSPDYDDWSLNGDILFYYPLLDKAFELSSMGIRVDKKTLESQLIKAHCEERKTLPFHQLLLNEKLPQTIGGGIGQSRICMFFLQKAHIGEVQTSVWDENTIKTCKENNIEIL